MAQGKAVGELLKVKEEEIDLIMGRSVPSKLLESKEQMLKVNLLNWQYMVMSNKGHQQPLNDFDCLLVNN